MQLTYVGSHDVVEVPDTGHLAYRHGDPIKVSEEQAARMLAQPVNWEPADDEARNLDELIAEAAAPAHPWNQDGDA